ncbi:MAG: MBL fold metallo-hydrolase [Deltaproteobacteria bacterium]|nr:MBL fold metallo-hydrolase [Deltaproteobacteria bacterium]
MERPSLETPDGYRGLALRTPTLPPAAHTNCYIVGWRDALIIDPGSPYPEEQALLGQTLTEMRGAGATFAAVLLTHHHPDHIGGALAAADLLGLPIVGHPYTLSQPALLDLSPRGGIEAIDEGQLIVDGERKIDLLRTPGHARGHFCLFESAGGVLIGGDMVPGIGTTMIDPAQDGDMTDYLAELRRLAALDPQVILPSHGPLIRPGRAAIEHLVAHRLQREEKIFATLVAGDRDLLAITREAYDDVPPTVWPLARRSALAHLHKLEADGRVIRTSPDGQACWRRSPSA